MIKGSQVTDNTNNKWILRQICGWCRTQICWPISGARVAARHEIEVGPPS